MRALVSVSDKTGLVPFVQSLKELGWDIIATGGTMKLLQDNNIEVINISEVTGFPEICDGRVKTLHPKRKSKHHNQDKPSLPTKQTDTTQDTLHHQHQKRVQHTTVIVYHKET